MDALDFPVAVSEAFGIDTAERAYPKLAGLSATAQFVQSRLAPGG